MCHHLTQLSKHLHHTLLAHPAVRSDSLVQDRSPSAPALPSNGTPTSLGHPMTLSLSLCGYISLVAEDLLMKTCHSGKQSSIVEIANSNGTNGNRIDIDSDRAHAVSYAVSAHDSSKLGTD
jgi:hypothetical protein